MKNNHNKLTTISDAWRNAYGKDYEEGLHFLLKTNGLLERDVERICFEISEKGLFSTLLEIGIFITAIMRSIQMS